MYQFHSRVRYSETDEYGRLSVTGIINYLQDCSTFQSEDIGRGVSWLKSRNRAWWLTSWQIVMDRYPVLGERIVVSTWPYDFKGIYGYRNFTIQDEAGAYLVRANSVWFFFDTLQGRPVRVQDEDVSRYGTLQPRLEMGYAPRHIALPEVCEEREPLVVAKHHIDTNHHVNNAQYVEIARELLPEDFQIGQLRAEYKKAAVLGDRIYPRISFTDDGAAAALCGEDKSPYAVIWLGRRREENHD